MLEYVASLFILKMLITRALVYVYLFIVRLRFPSKLSFIQVIHNRYGPDVVKVTRNVEKTDLKLRTAKLEL